MKNQLKESFAFYECDSIEIESLISQLIIKKSYGPYSIPTYILHLLKKDISKPLSAIFNLSLSTGTHPDLLKIAKTIPIFKMKGSMLERSNYRPISLLSNLNKLLEKVMFNRVYKFLEKYKCIFYRQFGFREKHSTNHALIEITESIRKALDNGRFACGIFIDLQKAFDTVNHDIIKIERLQKKCVRILSFAPFDSHSNKLFIDLNLLKVRDLISMSRIKLVHDFLNDRLPSDLMSLFRLSSNVHTTSQTLISAVKSHIFIPSFNTITYGKDSIRYQCAYLWNDLFKTGNIQIETNVTKNVNKVKMYSAKSFKETLKKHYLFSYTVEEPDFIFY